MTFIFYVLFFCSFFYSSWSTSCFTEISAPAIFYKKIIIWITLKKQNRRLLAQWPSALLYLAETLKSGMGTEQALLLLKSEAPEPLRTHLEAAMIGTGWVPLEARLRKIFSDPSLSLVKAAMLLSLETGGATAGILEKAAQILKDKMQMEGKMRTMTAQGRASAWIIGLSPAGLIAGFYFFSPDYFSPLMSTKEGFAVVCIIFLMIGIGLFFVHRTSKLEA